MGSMKEISTKDENEEPEDLIRSIAKSDRRKLLSLSRFRSRRKLTVIHDDVTTVGEITVASESWDDDTNEFDDIHVLGTNQVMLSPGRRRFSMRKSLGGSVRSMHRRKSSKDASEILPGLMPANSSSRFSVSSNMSGTIGTTGTSSEEALFSSERHSATEPTPRFRLHYFWGSPTALAFYALIVASFLVPRRHLWACFCAMELLLLDRMRVVLGRWMGTSMDDLQNAYRYGGYQWQVVDMIRKSYNGGLLRRAHEGTVALCLYGLYNYIVTPVGVKRPKHSRGDFD